MLVVGITGTVGAGKSTVGRLFERWGARRIDADELSREAVEPGSPALRSIVEEWGEGILRGDGSLDRAALREKVFGEPAARERLEEIVHPEVQRLRRERLRQAREEGVEVVVGEVPLLFETGMEDGFDLVVAVDAPRRVRRRRVCRERDVPVETFRAMEAAQWSADRKRSAADLVIENDGSLDELEQAARRAWDVIRSRVEEEGR